MSGVYFLIEPRDDLVVPFDLIYTDQSEFTPRPFGGSLHSLPVIDQGRLLFLAKRHCNKNLYFSRGWQRS